MTWKRAADCSFRFADPWMPEHGYRRGVIGGWIYRPFDKRIQFLILTRPYRSPWPLDRERRDPPGIFRSQDRVVRDWCRAAPPEKLFWGKTSPALPAEAYGYCPAKRCPWCLDPPFPRISRRRSVDRQTEKCGQTRGFPSSGNLSRRVSF